MRTKRRTSPTTPHRKKLHVNVADAAPVAVRHALLQIGQLLDALGHAGLIAVFQALQHNQRDLREEIGKEKEGVSGETGMSV